MDRIKLNPPRIAGRGRTVRRGQALLEFAISFGLIVILFFGIWIFWGYFQRAGTYVDTSQTLVELIARSHDQDGNVRLTPAMSTAIRNQINTSVLGNADATYLDIIAIDDATGTVLLQCGQAPPSPIGDNPVAPSDTGWDSCITAFDDFTALNPGGLPRGTRLLVDIWGLSRLDMPLLPFGTWLAPTGHSVAYTLG